jgi:glutamate--cysteine ligase
MADRNSPLITAQKDLADWLAQGEACPKAWRIGTEHEKFIFNTSDHRRPPYDGDHGIGLLLTKLNEKLGGVAIMEAGQIIGIKDKDGGAISLEPGGQFELSGAPLESLHDTCKEANTHLKIMREVMADLGLGMLGVGYDPLWGRDDIPWMPKGRYKIMRGHMPKVGTLGLDMMQRTSTIQVNLDYSDEKDMVRKFRVALALQPIATALFANSPFQQGRPSGLLSTRAQTWTDTDNARCGVPDCVFDDGFGYEEWVDYILDVPMYFLYRGGVYTDVAGLSFRDFMAGRLPGFEGDLPTMADWEDHITTAFPEVRLKQFLEMRGADGGPWNMICALPALWVGLLYDNDALTAAEDLAQGLTVDDVRDARMAAAIHGLRGEIGGRSMLEMGREMVNISAQGLKNRNSLSDSGDNETGFLDPLREIAETGRTQAEILLSHYDNEWGQDVRLIYRDFQF